MQCRHSDTDVKACVQRLTHAMEVCIDTYVMIAG